MTLAARAERTPQCLGAAGAGHGAARFQRAIELIGRRWSGAVVRALMPGPARYNRLLEAIPGISDKMLTERLRELERSGLVERLVSTRPPIRVSYQLTERGLRLRPVFEAVEAWAAGEAE